MSWLRPKTRSRYSSYRYRNGAWRQRQEKRTILPKLPLAQRTIIALIIFAVFMVSVNLPRSLGDSMEGIWRVVFLTHFSARDAGELVASWGSWGQKLAAAFGYETEQPAVSVMKMEDLPQFGMPVIGVISKGYTEDYGGINISTSQGYPVAAVLAGKVKSVRDDPELGLTVVISHGQGLETIYGHLNGVNVKQDQEVRQGTILGYTGNSGEATAPKLFFGVRLGDRPVDPLQLIQGK